MYPLGSFKGQLIYGC